MSRLDLDNEMNELLTIYEECVTQLVEVNKELANCMEFYANKIREAHKRFKAEKNKQFKVLLKEERQELRLEAEQVNESASVAIVAIERNIKFTGDKITKYLCHYTIH